MKPIGRRTITLLVGAVVLLLGAAGVNMGRITFADVRQTVDQAWGALPSSVVTRAIDGDTIELADGTRVRYIGVDSPELNSGHPECLAIAARDYNAGLVEGQTVYLEYDVTRQDKYGRDLSYVWVGSEMVNEQLAAAGYAQVMTISPNVKYADRFVAAEQAARQGNRGLWQDGACD